MAIRFYSGRVVGCDSSGIGIRRRVRFERAHSAHSGRMSAMITISRSEQVRHLGDEPFTAAAYCQARQRLPLAVLQTLSQRICDAIQSHRLVVNADLVRRDFEYCGTAAPGCVRPTGRRDRRNDFRFGGTQPRATVPQKRWLWRIGPRPSQRTRRRSCRRIPARRDSCSRSLRCTCGTPLGGSPLAGCSQPRCTGDETKKPLTCESRRPGAFVGGRGNQRRVITASWFELITMRVSL
jgi:hypothetical protein